MQNGAKSMLDSELAAERLLSVEEDLKFLRKALNEEIQMRHEIIGELGSLKRRNQVNKRRRRERRGFKEILLHLRRLQTSGR